MNAKQNVTTGFVIEQQLDSIQMSQYERDAALRDARVARIRFLVDAIVRVFSKLKRADADVFARPNLRYWE